MGETGKVTLKYRGVIDGYGRWTKIILYF